MSGIETGTSVAIQIDCVACELALSGPGEGGTWEHHHNKRLKAVTVLSVAGVRSGAFQLPRLTPTKKTSSLELRLYHMVSLGYSQSNLDS